MRRVAENGVLFHASGCQSEGRAIAHAAQPGHGPATSTACKLPPDLGARHVRAQIIHINPILAQKCQNILRRLDHLRGTAVFQCPAQRGETVFVIGVFGKVQRPDEVFHVWRRRKVFGRSAQFQPALILQRLLRFGNRNRHRPCFPPDCRERCEGGFGFLCRFRNLVQLFGDRS